MDSNTALAIFTGALLVVGLVGLVIGISTWRALPRYRRSDKK